jgi:hypothetical protein
MLKEVACRRRRLLKLARDDRSHQPNRAEIVRAQRNSSAARVMQRLTNDP